MGREERTTTSNTPRDYLIVLLCFQFGSCGSIVDDVMHASRCEGVLWNNKCVVKTAKEHGHLMARLTYGNKR